MFTPAGIFLGGLAARYLADPLGWRGLVAVGCLPVLFLAWVRRVPEFPRFLQAHGREQEARAAAPFLLFAGLLAAGGMVYLLAAETKGQVLS